MRLSLRVEGGGLDGAATVLPSADVRGLRIGKAARQLLLQLPSASDLSCHYEDYDAWHHQPKPIGNAFSKVVARLEESGLVWCIRRYAQGSDADWTYCLALSPLGADVVKVFGENMKRGQRIRWDKWDRPSVAFTDELCRERLKAMNLMIATETEAKRINPKATWKLGDFGDYGTSAAYLATRLRRFGFIWDDVMVYPKVAGGRVDDYLPEPV